MAVTQFRVTVGVAFSAALAAALKLQPPGAADPCQCLNWKETYEAADVDCGQGLEFTRLAGYPEGNYGSEDSPEQWLSTVSEPARLQEWKGLVAEEFCGSFYTKFDDNKCVRASMDRHPTAWYGKSWCYVSNECQSAFPVPERKVAVKMCAENGTDELLSDLPPEFLMDYGQKMGFTVPGFYVKVAYPVERSFFWKDRANFTDKVNEIMATEKPVVVDKYDEHQDKMIVVGGQVWTVSFGYDTFKCIEGCEE